MMGSWEEFISAAKCKWVSMTKLPALSGGSGKGLSGPDGKSVTPMRSIGPIIISPVRCKSAVRSFSLIEPRYFGRFHALQYPKLAVAGVRAGRVGADGLDPGGAGGGRAATRLKIVIDAESLSVKFKNGCDAILEGYRQYC
jgi:hypothetical protein